MPVFSKIRILIVDDHSVLRAGIRALLDVQPDFEVVGDAGDGQEALARVRELQPDVVLMDIGMPGIDGLAATRAIKDAFPEIRILILTQHENKEYVIPALKLGASGYVLKRADGDELLSAIRAVAVGDTFFDPRITGVLVDGVRRDIQTPTDLLDTLTEREREVFVMLARGNTYQQVAEALFITPKTVDFHRSNVMRKLNLNSRSELIRYALQRGLID